MNQHLLIIDSSNIYNKNSIVNQNNTFIIDRVSNMQSAIDKCCPNNYIMIIINADNINYINLLPLLREVNSFIYMVTKHLHYDKEIEAVELGTDFFGQWNGDVSLEIKKALTYCNHYIDRVNNYHKKRSKYIYKKNLLVIPSYRKLFINDENVPLTRKEFDLLCLLLSNTNQVFTYDFIFREVWKDNYMDVDKIALWNTVKRLRKKLYHYDEMKKYIRNVHDIGYAFEY